MFGAAFVADLAAFVRASRVAAAPQVIYIHVANGVEAELKRRGNERIAPFYVTDYKTVFLGQKIIKVVCLDSGIVDFRAHGKDVDTVWYSPAGREAATDRRLNAEVTNLDILEEALGEGADALRERS